MRPSPLGELVRDGDGLRRGCLGEERGREPAPGDVGGERRRDRRFEGRHGGDGDEVLRQAEGAQEGQEKEGL